MFNTSFLPPLNERVGRLQDYALKLANNAVFNIISFEDKIIGFAAYYCNDMLVKHSFLTQFAIDDNFKGQRIGSILLEFCIENLKQRGIKNLVCEVDETNFAALQFYEAHDFVFFRKSDRNSYFLCKYL